MTGVLKRIEDARMRYFPPQAEMYLFLIGGFLAFMAVLDMMIPRLGMKTFFLLAGGLVSGGLAFFGGLRLSLVLYFATFLGTAIVVPGIPVSLNRGMALLFVMAFCIEAVRTRARLVWHPAIPIFILLNVVLLTTTFLTTRPEWGYPIQPMFYLLVVAALALYFWRPRWMSFFCTGVTITGIFMIVLPGLFEALTGRGLSVGGRGSLAFGRVDGLAKNAIIFGYTATFMIPFILFWILESRRMITKATLLVLALGAVMACVATQNRQTPVVLAVTVAAFLLAIRHRHKLPILLTMGITGMCILPIFVLKLAARLETAGSLMKDASLMYRHDKLLVAKDMIADHFWFGVGHEHYQYMWWDYRPYGELKIMALQGEPMMLDSGYAQIFTEYGFIGFCLFMLLMITCGISLLKARSRSLRFADSRYTNLVALAIALQTHFLFSNIMADQFFTPQSMTMLGFVFAAISMVKLREQGVPESMWPKRESSLLESHAQN